ncbi:hypothetical protein NX779_03805 [Mycoplasma cottewii]|uniref:Transmembrane protein n=1 Tax=Mycoplasma cottewii TaxID=51364 RepID=A0ABY5TX26_9MOLU|nr:hypothetical protein [Mycoplasma cottewii]UWD34904.1 hypothetical protein NX779_03805 [Mycoplasma cottewii]
MKSKDNFLNILCFVFLLSSTSFLKPFLGFYNFSLFENIIFVFIYIILSATIFTRTIKLIKTLNFKLDKKTIFKEIKQYTLNINLLKIISIFIILAISIFQIIDSAKVFKLVNLFYYKKLTLPFNIENEFARNLLILQISLNSILLAIMLLFLVSILILIKTKKVIVKYEKNLFINLDFIKIKKQIDDETEEQSSLDDVKISDNFKIKANLDIFLLKISYFKYLELKQVKKQTTPPLISF